MSASAIEHTLLQFLSSATGQTGLTVEDDLITAGIVDSLTMMDLLVFIEAHFRIQLSFDELTPASFESVRALAEVVEGHLPTAAAGRAA